MEIKLFTHNFIFGFKSIFCRGKITTSPLLNLDKIKPSFEELEDENENYSSKQNLKVKKENSQLKSSQAILIGLKITAKTTELEKLE